MNTSKSYPCSTNQPEQEDNMKNKKEEIKNKDLMKSIKDAHKDKEGKSKPKAKPKKKAAKVEKVMKEFKSGKLHSGSKKGPKVTNPKQAIAIGLSEARKKGEKVSPKKKK